MDDENTAWMVGLEVRVLTYVHIYMRRYSRASFAEVWRYLEDEFAWAKDVPLVGAEVVMLLWLREGKHLHA